LTFERYIEIVKDLDGFRYTIIDGNSVENIPDAKPLKSKNEKEGTKL